MGVITILLLAVGLSMDAFAVSICKGLAMKKLEWKNCMIVGLWFGGFQALMPFIGYVLGVQFEQYIETVSSWIAFILLCIIGGNMVRESLSKNEEEEETATLHWKEMLLLAIATSIDALAVGITFACVRVTMFTVLGRFLNTVLACVMIGIITWFLSMVGVKIGNVFGTKYKSKAELAGGMILILLGVRILLQHFGILS